jgi:hypothetical protein
VLCVRRAYFLVCVVDLEKPFDSIDREALWFKARKKGVSDNMVCVLRKCMTIPNSV